MYLIFKGNKRFGSKSFFSYEAARSYLRKYIRKHNLKPTSSPHEKNYWNWDHSKRTYSNPSTSLYGFKIRQDF